MSLFRILRPPRYYVSKVAFSKDQIETVTCGQSTTSQLLFVQSVMRLYPIRLHWMHTCAKYTKLKASMYAKSAKLLSLPSVLYESTRRLANPGRSLLRTRTSCPDCTLRTKRYYCVTCANCMGYQALGHAFGCLSKPWVHEILNRVCGLEFI